jgi:hypothetical protein
MKNSDPMYLGASRSKGDIIQMCIDDDPPDRIAFWSFRGVSHYSDITEEQLDWARRLLLVVRENRGLT